MSETNRKNTFYSKMIHIYHSEENVPVPVLYLSEVPSTPKFVEAVIVLKCVIDKYMAAQSFGGEFRVT